MLNRIRFRTPLTVSLFILAAVSAAQGQYSGGIGTSEDPYQIGTAADLIALGETPEDYDKHFILTADLDLDPNLTGRKVFDRAVIAPDVNDIYGGFQGVHFTGTFDGNHHTISQLTVAGVSYLGLFGQIGSGATIEQLSLEAVSVDGTGSHIGGLLGCNKVGTIAECSSNGVVSGNSYVGGLVGANSGRGTDHDWVASIGGCYSNGVVVGVTDVGGLVGWNGGDVGASYSLADVSGDTSVGGLVGRNFYGTAGRDVPTYCYGTVGKCYAAGSVSGNEKVGGLVGARTGSAITRSSFWDIDTSGQTVSEGGEGKTTSEMLTANTFLGWGACGGGTWTIDEGQDYPRLWWEERPGEKIVQSLSDVLSGAGTEESPYLVYTAEELKAIGLFPCEWDKHFRLMGDIDLSGCYLCEALTGNSFSGIFDGNNHEISNLTIEGKNFLGLFAFLEDTAVVKNLGVIDVNIVGSDNVGGLVGLNDGGTIVNCYSTGAVSGDEDVGGLVGDSWEGNVALSRSTVTVAGRKNIGGLVGRKRDGSITECYSISSVTGSLHVGGLVGYNDSGPVVEGRDDDGNVVLYRVCHIANSYSSGNVTGFGKIGGVVGWNCGGLVNHCYSTVIVSGDHELGGLVGSNAGLHANSLEGAVTYSFWDIEVSGQTTSAGGSGLTTVEMQTASTFLDAGWDFVGETENGPNDVWKIVEGQTYPFLSWQKYGGGTGEPNDPYLIYTAEHLNALGAEPNDYDKHFKLMADVDALTTARGQLNMIGIEYGYPFSEDGPDKIPFAGVFDGNGHRISSFSVNDNVDCIRCSVYSRGLFGYVAGGTSEIKNLRLVDPNLVMASSVIGSLVGRLEGGRISNCAVEGGRVSGSRAGGLVGINGGTITDSYASANVVVSESQDTVGGLIGENNGSVIRCHSSSLVSGDNRIGGLIGVNSGPVTDCYSNGVVSGDQCIGGLVGMNMWWGGVSRCSSAASVSGNSSIGGLVGENVSRWNAVGWISECHSSGAVNGRTGVGGLVGTNDGDIIASYSSGTISGDEEVGGLVGRNSYGGYMGITASYNTGTVSGDAEVGGLVGWNDGCVTESFNAGTVTGGHDVGGLVGENYGAITGCHSTGTVEGNQYAVGGLVGYNNCIVATSYNTGAVNGDKYVGGLVGHHDQHEAEVFNCYSTGAVSGREDIGGLIGYGDGDVTGSFWDTATSGLSKSDGGTGLTTPEMQTASTFLDAGWDFIDETENGTDDIWWILEGRDYPRLWWELDEDELER